MILSIRGSREGVLSAKLPETAMVHPPQEDHEPLDGGGMRTAEQATDVTRSFLLVAAPDGGSAVDAVLLVVSELFTNAVLHAGGVTGFELKAGAGTVTVAAAHCCKSCPSRRSQSDAPTGLDRKGPAPARRKNRVGAEKLCHIPFSQVTMV